MSSSIDFGAIAIGAALGYGLKSEIKSAGTIARNALLAGIAGAAVTAAAEEAKAKDQEKAEAKEKKDGN